jgi:hypothetical protein
MKHGLQVLEATLGQLGKALKQETRAYLIGGCALTLRQMKDSTKDVDAILETPADLDALAAALKSMGFTHVHRSAPAYEKARNMLEKPGAPSFDLFYRDVCGGLHFTPTMKARAAHWKDYGNLRLFLLSDEDIFLFKAIAGREGDLDDAAEIIKHAPNWETVLEEVETQKLATKKEWIAHFAHFINELHTKYDVSIPILEKALKRGENELIRHLTTEKLKEGKTKQEIMKALELTKEEYENATRA